jgi:transposase
MVGLTTKIHVAMDTLGNPLRFILTPDQRHSITKAKELTKNISNIIVLTDKGYDSNTFVEILESQKCNIVIPPRVNRKTLRDYDKHIYKERHLIECCFSKIKYYQKNLFKIQ